MIATYNLHLSNRRRPADSGFNSGVLPEQRLGEAVSLAHCQSKVQRQDGSGRARTIALASGLTQMHEPEGDRAPELRAERRAMTQLGISDGEATCFRLSWLTVLVEPSISTVAELQILPVRPAPETHEVTS